MSPTALLAVVIPAVLVTSFLSGIFGIAGGLILMGVLLIVLPVAPAMILHAAVQSVSNSWRVLVWRRYARFDLLPGYIAGALLVAALLSVVRFVPDKSVVYLMMGGIPFLVTRLPKHWVPTISNRGAPFLCGVLITGIGLTGGGTGTILDQFYVHSGLDRREIVASKACTQTVAAVVRLTYFAIMVGAMPTLDDDLPLWVYGAGMATAVVGTTLARGILERMDDSQFRRWTQGLIYAVATIYLVRGIAGLIGWLAFFAS